MSSCVTYNIPARLLRRGSPLFLVLVLFLPVLSSGATGNLLRNSGFELDTNGDNRPDSWHAVGNRKLIRQELSLVSGRTGDHAARLECISFKGGSPSSHAMLMQGDVPISKGKYYRISLWAKFQGKIFPALLMDILDTVQWRSYGINHAVLFPSEKWRHFEVIFQAKMSGTDHNRFQLWFTSTGTLTVDDLLLEELEPDFRQPLKEIAAVNPDNLLANGGFEAGTSGWGSRAWGGYSEKIALNRLVAVLDRQDPFQGKVSLRIDTFPEKSLTPYFDYFTLSDQSFKAPLVANRGFVEVEPGELYTFYAFMKAEKEGTPARLAIRQLNNRSLSKLVTLTREWERYELDFTPTSKWCYVLAGPDLRQTQEMPRPPEKATVWLDGLQLRETPVFFSSFTTRSELECGLETEKIGNIFSWHEPVTFTLQCANSGTTPIEADFSMVLRDYFGRSIWRKNGHLTVEAGAGKTMKEVIAPSEKLRGFHRLTVQVSSKGKVVEHSLRMAAIPVNSEKQSRFGMNHAYPWDHLLELSKKAGITWVRDWSLKWHEVEPVQGHFVFERTDVQINRVLSHKMNVLGLLPFPSSFWASILSDKFQATVKREKQTVILRAFPVNIAVFQKYVDAVAGNYKDRVTWFQILNEPSFTKKTGYNPAEYAGLVGVAANAIRKKNTRAKILAGIGGLNDNGILEYFREFFLAGGLDAVDAVDIHHYPRNRPPEYIEPLLQKLNVLMDEFGDRKPIWMTETGYYADDEPWVTPLLNHDVIHPLAGEALQAAYTVRWAVIMFANGVEKIFYHAGNSAGINRDNLRGIFFKYNAEPRKVYAAQAVMAHYLTVDTRFQRELELPPGVKGYLFEQQNGRQLIVLWNVDDDQRVFLNNDKSFDVIDIMGRPVEQDKISVSGNPLYVSAHAGTDCAKNLVSALEL